MAGLLLVSCTWYPLRFLAKVMADVGGAAQTVRLGTVFTVGRGFTVIVNVNGVPGQSRRNGRNRNGTRNGRTTGICRRKRSNVAHARSGQADARVAVAPHAKMVPGTAPEKLTAEVGEPAQTV